MNIKLKAMYTTREAATLLSCTMTTIRRYITSKKLHAVRRGDSDYLIHENSIRLFLGLEPEEALIPVSMEKPDVTSSQ